MTLERLRCSPPQAQQVRSLVCLAAAPGPLPELLGVRLWARSPLIRLLVWVRCPRSKIERAGGTFPLLTSKGKGMKFSQMRKLALTLGAAVIAAAVVGATLDGAAAVAGTTLVAAAFGFAVSRILNLRFGAPRD